MLFRSVMLSNLKGKPNEVKEVYNALIKGKKLMRLDGQITVHMDAYNDCLDKLRQHFMKSDKITLAEFRDMIGTSRKYAVAVLENFDNAGYTKKIEDYRIKGTKIG